MCGELPSVYTRACTCMCARMGSRSGSARPVPLSIAPLARHPLSAAVSASPPVSHRTPNRLHSEVIREPLPVTPAHSVHHPIGPSLSFLLKSALGAASVLFLFFSFTCSLSNPQVSPSLLFRLAHNSRCGVLLLLSPDRGTLFAGVIPLGHRVN